MIQRADTVGVFQIESRAQMSMLPRLKPRELLRPGDRGRDRAARARSRAAWCIRTCAGGRARSRSPIRATQCEQVLERTLGVPIFQEQVMQLAIVAAGFTPGEADQLRRSMAAWKRSGGLEHFEQRLIDGMRARGYPQEFAEQIYQQILGFGEYGFPESHAASFALLVYVSAGSSAIEPAAFCARAAQHAADGLLCARAARAGRAPARRRGAAAPT